MISIRPGNALARVSSAFHYRQPRILALDSGSWGDGVLGGVVAVKVSHDLGRWSSTLGRFQIQVDGISSRLESASIRRRRTSYWRRSDPDDPDRARQLTTWGTW
jgi:hypothetical protein